MRIENGLTRKVFLIGRYAFKVPQTDYGWKYFLRGLLSSMDEIIISKNKYPGICPILFYVPGGWLIVMPRLKALSEEEMKEVDMDNFKYLDVEYKSDSFGWHNGKIVAIDYGEF